MPYALVEPLTPHPNPRKRGRGMGWFKSKSMVDRVVENVELNLDDVADTEINRAQVKAMLLVRRPELRGLSEEALDKLVVDAENRVWRSRFP